MNQIFRRPFSAVAMLLAFAALAAGAPNHGGPFALTLVAPKRPLRAGKQLILSVKVMNTSDGAVDVPVSRAGLYGRPGMVYRVHALDERGRPAPPWVPPPVPKGKALIGGSMPGFPLKPGQSLVDRVDVTHVYDLTRPGRYKIWIGEPYYRGPGLPNGLVKSNTITVMVVK